MAITLEEAKKNVQDDLQMGVIDEFQKSNWILEHIPFDDAVSPTGGGATPSYTYTRLKTQPTAQFREINTEYTPHEVTKEKHTVEIKVCGGAYEIDRVISNMGGIVNEVELQQSQKIKAAQALFNDTFINGDSAKDTKAFDGLDKALTGSDTEYNKEGVIDLSTSELITKNFQYFLDMLDEFLSELDGVPTMLIGNAALLTKIRSCARRAGYLTHSEDAFGRQMSGYNGIPFMDMQYYYDTSEKKEKPVVPITSREYGASSSKTTVTGLTDLYAVRLGLDGFHAVSPMGGKVISTTLPDFSTAGPVKAGDVEMVAATVLKKSRAAGVLRNFKVK